MKNFAYCFVAVLLLGLPGRTQELPAPEPQPRELPQLSPPATSLLRLQPRTIEAGDDPTTKLENELFNTALEKFQLRLKQFKEGTCSARELIDEAERVAYASVDPYAEPKEWQTMHLEVIEFCQTLENSLQQRLAANPKLKADLLEAKFRRVAAQLALRRSQTEPMPTLSQGVPDGPSENPKLALDEVIRAMGGNIKRDGLPDAPIIGIEFISSIETDATLERLTELQTLRSFETRGAGVTNAGLAHLLAHTNLESLVINSETVTDEGIKTLLPLKKLKVLSLGGTNLTDAALEHIGQFAQLERLTLPLNKQIGDEGLKHLSPLKLREFQLNGSKISNLGLKEIGKWSELNHLSLGDSFVTDAGLKELAGLKKLRWLTLSGCPVGDAGLKDLQPLSITTLWLSGTLVTDAGLDALAEVRSLRDLQLVGTKVTAAGVARFQERLPQCRVTTKWDDE